MDRVSFPSHVKALDYVCLFFKRGLPAGHRSKPSCSVGDRAREHQRAGSERTAHRDRPLGDVGTTPAPRDTLCSPGCGCPVSPWASPFHGAPAGCQGVPLQGEPRPTGGIRWRPAGKVAGTHRDAATHPPGDRTHPPVPGPGLQCQLSRVRQRARGPQWPDGETSLHPDWKRQGSLHRPAVRSLRGGKKGSLARSPGTITSAVRRGAPHCPHHCPPRLRAGEVTPGLLVSMCRSL